MPDNELPPWTTRLAMIREIFAGILATVVMGLFLLLILRALDRVTGNEFTPIKDLLAIVNPTVGLVIGYVLQPRHFRSACRTRRSIGGGRRPLRAGIGAGARARGGEHGGNATQRRKRRGRRSRSSSGRSTRRRRLRAPSKRANRRPTVRCRWRSRSTAHVECWPSPPARAARQTPVPGRRRRGTRGLRLRASH